MDDAGDMVASTISEFLNVELFTIGTTPFTPISAFVLLLAFVIANLLSHVARGAIRRGIKETGPQGEAAVATTSRVVHYVFMLLGLGIGLTTIGVNLSALFAAGALFAVAFGFAMQHVVANFVSGLLLMVERSIRPGDVIEINDEMVRVQDIRIRTTIVRNLNGDEIVVPNSNIAQSSVINHTLSDPMLRIRARVGVHHGSDVTAVQLCLSHVGRSFPHRVKSRDAVVFFDGIDPSALLFSVCVWIDDPWSAPVMRSRLLTAVWEALQASEITIAHPQLDLHVDPTVTAALAGRPPSAGQPPGTLN